MATESPESGIRSMRRRSGKKPNYCDNPDSDDVNSNSGEESNGDFTGESPPKSATKKSQPKAKGGTSLAKKADDSTVAVSAAVKDDSDSSPDDSDDEPRPKKRRGGRVKKVIPKLQKPKSKPNPKPLVPKFREDPATQDDSLYVIATCKPNSVPMTIETWWGLFARPSTKVGAVHELISFVIEVAGHKINLAPSLFKEEDDVDIDDELSKVEAMCLAEAAPEGGSLWKKTRPAAQLRGRLEDFFYKFVLLCPRSDLVELHETNLMTWINSLSYSRFAPLRQAASLAGLEILAGLATVGQEIVNDISNKSRLLAATSQSKQSSPEKVNRLREELAELGSCKTQIGQQIDSVFNAIFVNRSRDLVVDIRVRCMSALGKSIRTYKEKFLHNQYLKYIGWGLNDKAKEVRLASIEELIEIYQEDSDSKEELSPFTMRFKDRIVQMTNDIENSVAARAIHLCSVLYRGNIIQLDDDSWTPVYDNLDSDDTDVRNASASFIVDYYLKEVLSKMFEENKTASDQKREPFIMMGMVELIHNVIHDNETCTVHDIVRSFSSLDDWGLQDWALMCEILLDDGDESLENEQKETLLKLLTASLSVCPDEDFTSRKKKDTTKQEATQGVISFIPKMLSQLGSSDRILILLMHLVHNLELEAVSNQHKKDIEAIVKEISDTVLKGQDLALISAAAQALTKFFSQQYPLQHMIQPMLSLLLETLYEQFDSVSKSFRKSGKLSLSQMMWIQRIARVGNYVDVCSSEAHPEALAAAVSMLEHFHCVEDQSLPEEVLVKQMSEIIAPRKWILDAFKEIINSTKPFAIRMQAMIESADLMHFFGAGLQKQLSEAGAKDKEIRMSELILQRDQCVFDLFLQELTMMTKYPKAAGWKDKLIFNSAYEDDAEDESHIGKAVANCNLKSLMFNLEGETTEVTAGLIASLVLNTKHSHFNRSELVQLFAKEYSNTVADTTEATCWLQAHQKMFLRSIEAARANMDVEHFTQNMIDSIISMDLSDDLVMLYLKNAIDWAVQNGGPNIGFLECISLRIQIVNDNQAKDLLEYFDELLKSEEIDVHNDEVLINFRAKIMDVFQDDNSVTVEKPNRKKLKVSNMDENDTDLGSEIASEGMRTPFVTPKRYRSRAVARNSTSYEEDEEDFRMAKVPRRSTGKITSKALVSRSQLQVKSKVSDSDVSD